MYRLLLILFVQLLFAGCRQDSAFVLTEGKNIAVSHGMVVSASPESSLIGASILQNGGNAIDAAVATEFALAVSYPQAGNIGGGGFMLIRTSAGTSEVMDYREKAPNLASSDMYLEADGSVAPGSGTETHLASGVPGTVDGMLKVHLKYGKLSFREVIQPAIDLARNGFPVSEGMAWSLNINRKVFIERNSVRPAFVKDSLWKAGDLLRQPELAATLERIRDNGREGFYGGKTAELIVKEMGRGNGIISETDIKEYNALFRKSLTARYKGYGIVSVPPPSSGGIILIQLLKMVEDKPLDKYGFHSARAVHLIAEAEKRAFADRAEFAGDPDFINVPVNGLLNNEYLKKRFADFSELKASPSGEIRAGSPDFSESGETTHYTVVDQLGNAVSATTTLNDWYGSSIVVEGAGFLLNNQMDDFSVKPGVPNLYGLIGGDANAIAPGKRMLSSMTPVIVEKEGKLFFTAGSPGGSTIPTTVFQVIINVIDYNMNIKDAVDTARFHNQWLPDCIFYETGSMDSTVLNELIEKGHELREMSMIGSVNAIMVLQGGKKVSGADRRGDNTAFGY
jgi:gamma-glutamyltranspeptidase/glutathione hydrolase